MEEVTRLSTQKNVTVFTGKIKVGPICPTFIRGDPYEPERPSEKSPFQAISWSGSRHLKVVNPFAWLNMVFMIFFLGVMFGMLFHKVSTPDGHHHLAFV